MSHTKAYNMMHNLITDFPKHLQIALDAAHAQSLDKPDFDFHNVLIVGMGGSGIGGVLVKNWILDDIAIPVVPCHDYSIPNFVNDKTLVIASSYSGNTEETLMALEEAHENGAYIIGVCSGGKIQAFCQEHGYRTFLVPGGNPPRAALGFSIVMLLSIFEKMELVTNRYTAMIQTSIALIHHEMADLQEQGKQLAHYLHGKTPIFYATTHFEGVAVRARQQVNENSKALCWHHVIPEMNHNELLGWTGGNATHAPVILLSQHEFNRNVFRVNLSKEEMENRGASTITYIAKGKNRVEEALYLIHLVDWASFYLAEMRQQDPVAIPVIDRLKEALADINE